MRTTLFLALQFVNLFATAIVSGGQIFCLRALVSARQSWPPELGAKVHQDAMTARPDGYIRPAAAVALLTALLIAGLEAASPGPALVLMLLGVVGLVAVAVISVRWEFPINREINSWQGKAVPVDRYLMIRKTWDEKHLLRTIAGTVALVCFILACLLRQQTA
jgi:hypothetical protein